jgi:SAM-dependent methyltransferase
MLLEDRCVLLIDRIPTMSARRVVQSWTRYSLHGDRIMPGRASIDSLYEKYYLSQPGYRGGTLPFFDLCHDTIPAGSRLLEIGSGPSNEATFEFAKIGPVTGVDVSDEIFGNTSLVHAVVFDGVHLPFPDRSFDAVVSNWVMEHVEKPLPLLKEVRRVLRPGGMYCFRTINLFHYMPLGSKLIPRRHHAGTSKSLRRMDAEDHEPWPTYYRANSRGKLRRLFRDAGFVGIDFRMIECEPRYTAGRRLLFYPMMAYERLVNSSKLLEGFRIILSAVARTEAKGSPPAGAEGSHASNLSCAADR